MFLIKPLNNDVSVTKLYFSSRHPSFTGNDFISFELFPPDLLSFPPSPSSLMYPDNLSSFKTAHYVLFLTCINTK